jgi:hypothetical protein
MSPNNDAGGQDKFGMNIGTHASQGTYFKPMRACKNAIKETMNMNMRRSTIQDINPTMRLSMHASRNPNMDYDMDIHKGRDKHMLALRTCSHCALDMRHLRAMGELFTGRRIHHGHA